MHIVWGEKLTKTHERGKYFWDKILKGNVSTIFES